MKGILVRLPRGRLSYVLNNGLSGYHVFLNGRYFGAFTEKGIRASKTGGHYVTPNEIEKNYIGNLVQLNLKFDVLDELIVADNSKLSSPSLVLHISEQKSIFIADTKPDWFRQYLNKILA